MSFVDELRNIQSVSSQQKYDDDSLNTIWEAVKRECKYKAQMGNSSFEGYIYRDPDPYGGKADFYFRDKLPEHEVYGHSFNKIFAKEFHFNFTDGFKPQLISKLSELGLKNISVRIDTIEEEEQSSYDGWRHKKSYMNYKKTGRKVQVMFIEVSW